MRLLVVTNLFFPDRGGGAAVFSDMCFGLKSLGWDITVFTTHPYYPEWHRKFKGSPWKIHVEEINGVRVFRHGLYVPSEPSKLFQRIVYELSFGASLLRSLFRCSKFDVIMVYCPMLGAVMFSALRHVLTGEPLWLNVQDIPADAAEASGISRNQIFNSLASWLQQKMFNVAGVWSTISPLMRDRLLQIQKRGQLIHLCPNWLNSSIEYHIKRLPSKIGRPLGSPLRLLYAGNIGKKQGLLEFCKILAKSRLDFIFKIHGDGGESQVVGAWVAGIQDSRFRFGGFLDESGFTTALHEADLFVITEKPGSGASFIPSKLIPGIATGTPIIALCDRSGPLGVEMTESGLGLVLEWTEIDRLNSLLDDREELSQRVLVWQNNCLQRAITYDRSYAIPRIGKLIEETPHFSSKHR
jgi:colanic acid biosynthesis glycosyl transferase WcaI